MFCAIGLLIKSAPSTVNIEDNEEMNPIEYAIASGAHLGSSRRCKRQADSHGTRERIEKGGNDMLSMFSISKICQVP